MIKRRPSISEIVKTIKDSHNDIYKTDLDITTNIIGMNSDVVSYISLIDGSRLRKGFNPKMNTDGYTFIIGGNRGYVGKTQADNKRKVICLERILSKFPLTELNDLIDNYNKIQTLKSEYTDVKFMACTVNNSDWSFGEYPGIIVNFDISLEGSRRLVQVAKSLDDILPWFYHDITDNY